MAITGRNNANCGTQEPCPSNEGQSCPSTHNPDGPSVEVNLSYNPETGEVANTGGTGFSIPIDSPDYPSMITPETRADIYPPRVRVQGSIEITGSNALIMNWVGENLNVAIPQSPDPVTLAVPLAPDGYYRNHRAVLWLNGTVEIVAGSQGDVAVAPPDLEDGMIHLAIIPVYGSTISPPQDAAGFVTKASFDFNVIYATGTVNNLVRNEKKTYLLKGDIRQINGIEAAASAPVTDPVYENRRIVIINESPNDVILAYQNVSGQLKFKFYSGLDFILHKGESAEFIESKSNFTLWHDGFEKENRRIDVADLAVEWGFQSNGQGAFTAYGKPNLQQVGTQASGTIGGTRLNTPAVAGSSAGFIGAGGGAHNLQFSFSMGFSFQVQDVIANTRALFGIAKTSAATALLTTNPSSFGGLAEIFAVGWDDTDTSLALLHSITGSSVAKISLGGDFPIHGISYFVSLTKHPSLGLIAKIINMTSGARKEIHIPSFTLGNYPVFIRNNALNSAVTSTEWGNIKVQSYGLFK